MRFLYAFLVGGAICAVCQIIIDKTQVTPARILVGLVILGTILGGLGLYDYVVDFAGAGATVPLIGFGHVLAKGAIEGAQTGGLLGAFMGGLRASSAGITAAIVFGFLNALIFDPKTKK